MKTTKNVENAVLEISKEERTMHIARFFNRVISSTENAVFIDADINIARIFALDSVDFAVLANVYTMSETKCLTFSELKEKTAKYIEKSGIAIANKNDSLLASFYKWGDILTDDRIKKSIMILASMYNGFHIVFNKNGIVSVQKLSAKNSLLSAKFYKNVELLDKDGNKSKEKIRVTINPDFLDTFGKALETANYKLVTSIVKPIAVETTETETAKPEGKDEETARAENLKKSEETRLKNSSGSLAENPETETAKVAQ